MAGTKTLPHDKEAEYITGGIRRGRSHHSPAQGPVADSKAKKAVQEKVHAAHPELAKLLEESLNLLQTDDTDDGTVDEEGA